MSFVIGDLVVDRFSKAIQLKRKLYRVVHVNSLNSGMSIMDCFGKTKDAEYSWQYVSLEQYETILTERVTIARNDADRAQRKIGAANSNLNTFREEKSKTRQWFPKV